MTLRVEVPGEKIVSVEPCKCSKQYGTELKKTETKLSKRLKQFLKESWAFRSKVTVEPFVICYVLPSVLAGLAVQNLSLEKSCLVNLHYDERTCTHIMQGRTHNYSEQERNVQTLVASMTAWSFPLQTALPGILTLFLGAWSDRTGNRKAFMVLPILGKLISTIGLILSTVFFLQVGMNETALIEGLPPALAGGRVAMTMAVYSYITDITSDSERTFRLGIITAILTLSRPIGMALSGIMTRRFGYYGVFMVACVFYLFGFVYIILRLKEKTKKTKEVESDKTPSILSVLSVKDFVATVNVAFKVREGSRRVQIILIMFAYMFIVGPVLGEAQMTYWFTRYKFKFTEVDYSLYLTYSVLVGSVGSFITIYLFSKRWNMEDSIIGVIACLSRIAAAVVYAMAPNRTIYFLGPVLDMFSSAGATSLRSIATKLVDADEVGKTSSLISISEALVPVIYSPVYSKVYLTTLSTMPGAFYLISASLAVPAIAIYLALFTLRRKDEREQATPEPKPKENEITRF
ncbi:proton-coupled folate transporter [Spodoptera frugiperda]|uniref:Proton-coupled folate transporter n=1 Tax=Spodoptera frugiperda TaxID=7108 RepID=A0A9R0EI20_SPOFR|nr:proton-coupled folate transporter [Spodoptera frugiperda]